MSKLPDDDSGGALMPILVSLLVVVGIGTAGLFGYIGIRLTANPPEEVPASSVAQPHKQPQTSGKASSSSGGVMSIDGVRATSENNDTDGQTQVSNGPSDNQGAGGTVQKDSGASMGTQAGGDISGKFAAGKALITTASDNNKDPVYHTKYCRSAQKIDQNDMYWYDSAEAAVATGRRLCGNCSK